MPYVTSIERMGIEKRRQQGRQEGRQEGLQEGIQRGEASLLRRQLVRRFGALPSWAEQRLEQASLEELERWVERVLEVATLAEVFGSSARNRHEVLGEKGYMLTAYINAAMRKAHYEILPGGEGFFGKIENLQGVWANADTLEACREELQEVLEEWIALSLKMGHLLPEIDGITLNIQKVA